MLTSFQKKRDKLITSGIFIAVLVFGTFYAILYSLIGLMSIDNGFPTTKGLIAQLFFILGIFIITTAFLSTFLLNKRSWPQVNAKITYSSVARNRFSVSISWTLKHVVFFTFNNHEYFKSFYSNLSFSSRQEAEEYLQKFSRVPGRIIPIYVFKYFPRLSSESCKVNFFYLIYCYGVILISGLLMVFGFLLHLLDTGMAKIVTTYSNDGSSENSTIVFQQSFKNIITVIESAYSVVFILFLIILGLFLIRTIYLVYHNKLFYFISGFNLLQPYELDTYQTAKDKLCLECNTVNDSDSVFCYNCGSKLYY